MEKKVTIFSFLAEALVIFSVGIIFITLCTFFIGSDAQDSSSLFTQSSKGVSNTTILQFLLFSMIIEFLNKFWYSERLAAKMMVLLRTILLLLSIVVVVAIFSALFGWFMINNIHAWIGFLIIFAIFFAMSVFIMVIKTNMENKKVEEGLTNYKKEREKIHDK